MSESIVSDRTHMRRFPEVARSLNDPELWAALVRGAELSQEDDDE